MLKIAITVDPEIAVPPLHYGGIERIVDFLVTEFLKQGYEIYLFSNKSSRNDCHLKIWPGSSSVNKFDTIKNTLFLTKEFTKNRFDVIHSFSRLAYLSLVLPLGAKCIMSYQREPTIKQIILAQKFALWKNLFFTGCSNYITDQIRPFAKAHTVYNGVNMLQFDLEIDYPAEPNLVFLGRIEPIKGTHNAIALAKATNSKLTIAGNIPKEYQCYFDTKIKPHLNKKIVYIGPVNDDQKNVLLQNATALLMLNEWNEPFGIVMAEALACGTPIIGTPKGAITEIVLQNRNGFMGEDLQSWTEIIKNISSLNRAEIRKDAEIRFSSKAISQNYLKLYKDIF